VSHLVYTAVFEKPGLIAGWTDDDQMQPNLAMLRNLLEPLAGDEALEQVTPARDPQAGRQLRDHAGAGNGALTGGCPAAGGRTPVAGAAGVRWG